MHWLTVYYALGYLYFERMYLEYIEHLLRVWSARRRYRKSFEIFAPLPATYCGRCAHSHIHSLVLVLHSGTDSSNCVVKKFGESWINGTRNDRPISMAGNFTTRSSRFSPPLPLLSFPPICARAYPVIYAVDFIAVWILWLLTLDVFSIPRPIYNVWHAFQVPHVSERI